MNDCNRRLGILATHPIQYHAPLFRKMASYGDFDLMVYFCHRPTPQQQGVGFGISFQWDVDLTSGYPHTWLRNRSFCPSLTSFWGCNTPEIADIIQRKKFDAFVVHGWNNRSCWQAFHACWQSGTPLIVCSDSQLLTKRSSIKRLLKTILYPLFIKRFDICLAYGQRSAEYFRYYGAKTIHILPHFVDNAWFAKKADEARKNRDDIRARWGIEKDIFVFLFAGKFEPMKRPFDAIEALAKLQQRGVKKNALLMVGDGALREICMKTTQKKGLSVSFAGFLNQSEMPQAYAVADCLVLCSDAGETWGLVVNEAMACGLPAIVSNEAGCVPDLIIEGQTGYSYPKGDTDTLSNIMCSLVTDRAELKKLGQNAQKHIQMFSPENAAKNIRNILMFLEELRA